MQHPPRQEIPRQDYPLPWTMPDADDPEESSALSDASPRLEDLSSSLEQWLRAFGDGKTGGSAPPPMH